MVFINEIIKEYEDGKITLEEANEKLNGTGIYLNPDKNVIDEKEKAVYCEDISKINGYALLDIGIGNKEKVMIKNGKLVEPIAENREQNVMGIVIIGDKFFYVYDGKTLEEKE